MHCTRNMVSQKAETPPNGLEYGKVKTYRMGILSRPNRAYLSQ